MLDLKNRLLVLLLLPLMAGYGQELLTLEGAVQEALTTNQQIKIRRYDAEVAALQVDPAVVGRKPVVNFNAAYELAYRDASIETLPLSPEQPASSSIGLNGFANTVALGPEVNLLLLDGKASKYRLEQLGAGSDLARLQLRATTEQIVAAVSSTYLELARQQSLIGITEQNIALSQERLARAEQDAAYGTSGSLEELQISVDLKTDSANLRNQLLNYNNLQRELNRLMGRSAESEVRVDSQLSIQTNLQLADLESSLRQRSTQLQLSQQNIRLADLDIQLSKAAYKPRLQGYANFNYTYITDESSFLQTNRVFGPAVGLTFQYPLYDGGARKIQEQSAVLRAQQRQVERTDTEAELIKELRNAYATYQNTLDQLRIEESNVVLFERNFENIRNRYQLGTATNTDVRTAQLNLNAALNRINNYQYTIKQAEVALYLLSGQLVN